MLRQFECLGWAATCALLAPWFGPGGAPKEAPAVGSPLEYAISEPPQPRDEPAHVAVGRHFTVRCHWRSEKSLDAHAVELARVLDAVGDAAVAAGCARPAGAMDGVRFVDVYETPRALERATAALEGASVERSSGAVVDFQRSAVHLALRPRVADRVHARLGTSPFLLRRAAHEGARAWVAASQRTSDADAASATPPWAVRAAALALAEAGLCAASRSLEPRAEPATSHGLVLLAQSLAAGADPLVLLSAPGLEGAGHGEAYDASDAARLAVAEGLGVEVLLSLRAEGDAFSSPRWAAEEPPLADAVCAIVRAAAEAAPQWEVVGPGAAVLPARVAATPDGDAPEHPPEFLDPGGLAQWAAPRADALLLATESIDAPRYVIAGTFEPHALDGESPAQADVAFAARGDGDRCVCVFSTREGTWVLKRDPATGEYAQIAGERGLRPIGGALNSFELRIEGDTVVVALNGELMRPGRASGVDLRGRWGLGAHAGSAVLWRGAHWVPAE